MLLHLLEDAAHLRRVADLSALDLGAIVKLKHDSIGVARGHRRDAMAGHGDIRVYAGLCVRSSSTFLCTHSLLFNLVSDISGSCSSRILSLCAIRAGQ